jgi:hypothetical protein
MVLIRRISVCAGRRAAIAAVVACGVVSLTGVSDAHTGAASAASGVARARASSISPAHLVKIFVLDGRADVTSGGVALAAVTLPAGSNPSSVRVELNGRDVTREFAVRANGRYEALVTGLVNGPNTLVATLPDGYGARLTIANHPIGGPVIAGPQIQPWVCPAGAKDPQCDQPPTYTYEYMPASGGGLLPYDPSNPPPSASIEQKTTQTGVTVPFIVRIETGYEDRDQYQTAVLYQPGKPWEPWSSQPQFAHKLLITHGASCGGDHDSGTAPSVTSDGVGVPGGAVGSSPTVALGLGYAVMSTALDNAGHDCNLATEAESLIMAKQHVIDEYGELRFTIGTGCSGGSLVQQSVANAYPGVYQGILPQCSFPDVWSSATEIAEFHLLNAYFENPANAAPGGVPWTPSTISAVEGSDLPVNAVASDEAFFDVAEPTYACAGVTAQQRYNPTTNPGGVRCGIADYMINVLGPRPPSVWTANEKKLGHGFAGLPIGDVGVQYGLGGLKTGTLTPAQFADLNAKIGGLSIDITPTAARSAADEPALANAYRSGMINEANNLNQVAIIDLRGPNDPGAAHDSYRSFAMRARLDRDFGTHANQVIWEGPAPLIGDTQYTTQALMAMDRWLSAVAADTSDTPLAQKIIRDKPADITDQCSNGDGTKVSSGLCPSSVVPVYGTPRTVAGDQITTDNNECQLQPLVRSSYPVTFTDAEWAQLEGAFPSGVCDFSKPGVSQQPTIPWLTYQDAAGHVIYGGRPLGPAPVSIPFGPTVSCARLSGRLVGRSLSPVLLGMTRARARSLFARSATRGRRYMDFFCPAHNGIRAGYPSPALLRPLSRPERRRVQGRVVLALTSNPHYALHGVRAGVRLAKVARRLGVGRGFRIGLNTWYLEPNGQSRGVLKVRHGIIEEIGIANKQLTTNRRSARRFLASFS